MRCYRGCGRVPIHQRLFDFFAIRLQPFAHFGPGFVAVEAMRVDKRMSFAIDELEAGERRL
jgi:hypothetical protein